MEYGHLQQTTQFERDMVEWDRIKARTKAASAAMNTYPRGPTGLTPDEIKATKKWKSDYAEMQSAMAAERIANGMMLKRYPREIKAARAAEREAKLAKSGAAS